MSRWHGVRRPCCSTTSRNHRVCGPPLRQALSPARASTRASAALIGSFDEPAAAAVAPAPPLPRSDLHHFAHREAQERASLCVVERCDPHVTRIPTLSKSGPALSAARAVSHARVRESRSVLNFLRSLCACVSGASPPSSSRHATDRANQVHWVALGMTNVSLLLAVVWCPPGWAAPERATNAKRLRAEDNHDDTSRPRARRAGAAHVCRKRARRVSRRGAAGGTFALSPDAERIICYGR